VQIIVTGGGSFLVFTYRRSESIGYPAHDGTDHYGRELQWDANFSWYQRSDGYRHASGGQLATSTGCTTATIPANGIP